MTIAPLDLNRFVFGFFVGLMAIASAGCDDPHRVLAGHAQSASTGGFPAGRAAAAAAMVNDWKAGRITLDAAIDHAFALIESGSGAATTFAGAVLDFAQSIEDAIPDDPATSEILLRRLGRLAFQSAELAYLNHAAAEAESLVLAGPARWQREPYWLRYPDHDALVSILLAARGEVGEAKRRLQERSVLEGVAAETLERLKTVGTDTSTP